MTIGLQADKFGAGPWRAASRAESGNPPSRLPAPIQMGAHHPDDPMPSRTLGSALRALFFFPSGQ